ncbi:MAG: aldo/keto reductase [Dehalococcoidales bacterium]|nr:aldo/keto reductase [Dehalococcoidales bacterium]
MRYRNLGKSGLKVSEIGLGTLEFGRRLNEQESISMIRHAIDLGVNFIDTADVYGDGRSEVCVGKAVKDIRRQVIIATKFGIATGQYPNDHGGSRAHIMNAVDASLKRLDTDYVDLYYIHWPDPATPIEETLRTLDSLVQAGKVRYIACSNFPAWQLCEALWISRMNKLESFAGVQTRYNMIDRSIEPELAPCCQKYGVGIIPWGPLAEGFLTGKYQRGKPLLSGTRLGSQVSAPPPRKLLAGISARPGMFAPILTETNYEKLEKYMKFAAERGHTIGELAISWLLSHSWLSSVIAGATGTEQVSDNIAAADWVLTEEEKMKLE